MFRNSRAARKPTEKQTPATDREHHTRQLIVWRRCKSCDWEHQGVEAEDADVSCPRCHAVTEVVALSPAPAGAGAGECVPSGTATGQQETEPGRLPARASVTDRARKERPRRRNERKR
jgi:hypothetical protein